VSTTITASQVKELRDATGAGMMECKRALEETGGDFEAARTLLRERGLAQAGKRAGRATSEGIVLTLVNDDQGTLVAVGCETEPVSKNDEFRRFADSVLELVADSGPDAVDQLDEQRRELIGKLGENIVVIGAERVEGGTLGAYIHPPANKIGVLVQLEGGDAALARQVAMHIAFAAPAWTTKDEAPSGAVEDERQIYLNSDELQGKPEQAKEKIVEGMLQKRFYAAQPGGALNEQPWIHDSAQTVGQALAAQKARVVAFRRFSVAE
jgi:elongation factor Ts